MPYTDFGTGNIQRTNKLLIIVTGENEIQSTVKVPIKDNESVENVTGSLTDAMNDPELLVTVNIIEDPFKGKVLLLLCCVSGISKEVILLRLSSLVGFFIFFA